MHARPVADASVKFENFHQVGIKLGSLHAMACPIAQQHSPAQYASVGLVELCGFTSTNLPLILSHNGIKNVVLAGFLVCDLHPLTGSHPNPTVCHHTEARQAASWEPLHGLACNYCCHAERCPECNSVHCGLPDTGAKWIECGVFCR